MSKDKVITIKASDLINVCCSLSKIQGYLEGIHGSVVDADWKHVNKELEETLDTLLEVGYTMSHEP